MGIVLYMEVLAWGGYRFIDIVMDTYGPPVCFGASLVAGAVVATYRVVYLPLVVMFGLVILMFAGVSSVGGDDGFTTLLNLPWLALTEMALYALGVLGRRLTVRALQRRRRLSRRSDTDLAETPESR